MGEVITKYEYIAPKKVLPISPMKILAGNLFQNINPNIEPFKTHRFKDDSNANVIKTINIHEESKPSIPSIKLEKLITALIKITKIIIIND